MVRPHDVCRCMEDGIMLVINSWGLWIWLNGKTYLITCLMHLHSTWPQQCEVSTAHICIQCRCVCIPILPGVLCCEDRILYLGWRPNQSARHWWRPWVHTLTHICSSEALPVGPLFNCSLFVHIVQRTLFALTFNTWVCRLCGEAVWWSECRCDGLKQSWSVH